MGGAVFAQTIRTDKQDYIPGEAVVITGRGWQPGENVAVLIDEIDHRKDTNLLLVADANGYFQNADFSIKRRHEGAKFIATATGQTSGDTHYWVFWDAGGDFSADFTASRWKAATLRVAIM
jgi:hypothetical protein